MLNCFISIRNNHVNYICLITINCNCCIQSHIVHLSVLILRLNQKQVFRLKFLNILQFLLHLGITRLKCLSENSRVCFFFAPTLHSIRGNYYNNKNTIKCFKNNLTTISVLVFFTELFSLSGISEYLTLYL